MSKRNHHFYEFGPFRLDPLERRLQRDGKVLALTPKAFEVLLLLVVNGGHVLRKDEFLEKIWAGSYVEEKNLADNISLLRKVLGDDVKAPSFIQTVPRMGYRFVAEVREVTDESKALFERTRTHIVIEEETRDAPVAASTPIETYPTTHARDEASAKPRTSWLRQRRVPLAVSALGLTLIGGVLIFKGLFSHTPQKDDRRRMISRDMTVTRVTNSGKMLCSTISPDGKLIAYAQNYTSGTGSLYVRQVNSNHEIQLLEPGQRIFGATAFSPDSTQIYFVVYDKLDPEGALYCVPALGGLSTRLIGNFGSMFTLSPDGRSVTFFRKDRGQKTESLIIATLDGGKERALLTRPDSDDYLNVSPAWSPDAKMIAFGVVAAPQPGADESVTIHGINVDSGETRPLTNERWASLGKMNWMPDGRGLVFVARRQRLGQQVYYVSYPEGEARYITNDLGGFGSYGLGITENGKVLVAESWQRSAQLWTVGADGDISHATQLTTGDDDGEGGIAALPDGTIVYVARGGGTYDLWKIKADGTDPRPLTADSFHEQEVAASPDGRYLAFASDRTGSNHIFLTDADGMNPKQLTFGDARDGSPDFSPDSRWLVYASSANDKTTVWKVAIEGGTPIRLTDYQCIAPNFSPDGKFISCVIPSESRAKLGSVAVIRAEGGPPIKTFEVIQGWSYLRSRWIADGTALIFHKTENQIVNLWKQPLTGGPPSRLTDFKSDVIFNYTLTPDGRRIILARGQVSINVVLIRDFMT
jgi:Tol biopolymer transport system component/DNA-binding winged helix-turn-helix (wHTH) protein